MCSIRSSWSWAWAVESRVLARIDNRSCKDGCTSVRGGLLAVELPGVLGSNQFPASGPSSATIMLCKIMHVYMMSTIFSINHCRAGALIMFHQAWRTPNALSTSLRAASCFYAKRVCFSFAGLLNVFTKVGHFG